MKRYYAVRYISARDQIRIEKGDTPVHAAKLCFGGPIFKDMKRMEFKDMGSTVAIMRSDTKRIAMLKDPKGWVNLYEATFPANSHPKKKRNDIEPRLKRNKNDIDAAKKNQVNEFKEKLEELCREYGFTLTHGRDSIELWLAKNVAQDTIHLDDKTGFE